MTNDTMRTMLPRRTRVATASGGAEGVSLPLSLQRGDAVHYHDARMFCTFVDFSELTSVSSAFSMTHVRLNGPVVWIFRV